MLHREALPRRVAKRLKASGGSGLRHFVHYSTDVMPPETAMELGLFPVNLDLEATPGSPRPFGAMTGGGLWRVKIFGKALEDAGSRLFNDVANQSFSQA